MEKNNQNFALLNYLTYNNNFLCKSVDVNKLVSTNNGEVLVQPMWRMELVGKYYGINILEYRDDTNYELLDEMLCSSNNTDEREECYNSYYRPNTYEQYFEDLAEVAAQVGSERAEIKCLIKSLILQYQQVDSPSDFPHKPFYKLFKRLVDSPNPQHLKVAQRLTRHHTTQFTKLLNAEINTKIWHAENETNFTL